MFNPDFLYLTLLLSLSFFCSGSETALFSLSIVKQEDLKRKYPKRGTIISDLVNMPQKLLTTILMLNTFANVFATLTASRIFQRYFPDANIFLLIVVMTLLVLIFGEVTPKSLAIRFAPKISLFVAPVFYFFLKFFTPLVLIFRCVSSTLVTLNSKIFFISHNEPEGFVSDEMHEVIRESEQKGILNQTESEILRNVIDFGSTDIWKLARPRKDIFSLSVDTLMPDVIEKIKERKFSRVPVWEDFEENITGILYIKELLKINVSDNKKLSDYKNILRKPLFIPESVKAEQMLKYFQTTDTHIAIVIDEFGGISGLISLEDILEGIIGDVVDKDDVIPLFHKYNNYMIEIEAVMEIDEFNKVFKTDIRCKENSTVGGYVLEKIKRIPKTGEIFIFNNLQYKIAEAAPNKIKKLFITKLKKIDKKRNPFLRFIY